ncbi:MAG: hypothetical protein OXU75_04145 [Deltaproteobacteria bacterium]|nr:hypothetical protein [Deltaproteobacteria bacterium]
MREETKITEVAAGGRESGNAAEERGTADAFDAVTLFDADGVDVDQYADTVQRKTPLEPEKHLLLAILEDGLACYRKNLFARTAKKQADYRDAEEWIFATDDERFLSFESVCGVLGIEPSYLRRGLVEWKERKVRARANAPAEAA